MAKIGLKFRLLNPAIMPRANAKSCDSVACVDDLSRQPKRILLLTDDDHLPELTAIRKRVAEVAATHGAAVALYDLKAAGYLTDPYPHFASGEWKHSLGKEQLRMLGRGYLVRQIEEFEQHGVAAAAILPEHHGFAHLADWAKKERVDLMVVPGKWARPSLWDRVRGYTLTELVRHTDIPVAVYEADGSAWLANAPRVPA